MIVRVSQATTQYVPVPLPPPVSSFVGVEVSSRAKTTQYVPVPLPPPVSSLAGGGVVVSMDKNAAREEKESIIGEIGG